MSASTPQQLEARPPRPMWMLALFAVAAVIGLFNLGFFLYGLTLPSNWSVEESVEIDASPEDVATYLVSPRRWSEWSSWSDSQDATAEFIYEGPESGEGAAFSWRGEQLGVGKLTITEVSHDLIRYDLAFQGETFSENGRITFQPTAGGTRIVWSDAGEVSGTIGRVFRERFEASVAADFAASLNRLKQVVESTPPAKAPSDSAGGESSGTQ
jgi:hypothetical protein